MASSDAADKHKVSHSAPSSGFLSAPTSFKHAFHVHISLSATRNFVTVLWLLKT